MMLLHQGASMRTAIRGHSTLDTSRRRIEKYSVGFQTEVMNADAARQGRHAERPGLWGFETCQLPAQPVQRLPGSQGFQAHSAAHGEFAPH